MLDAIINALNILVGGIITSAVAVLVAWLFVVAPIAALVKPQEKEISGGMFSLYTYSESGVLGSTRAFGMSILKLYGTVVAAVVLGVLLVAVFGAIDSFINFVTAR
jgi:hypothetical protein